MCFHQPRIVVATHSQARAQQELQRLANEWIAQSATPVYQSVTTHTQPSEIWFYSTAAMTGLDYLGKVYVSPPILLT